MPDKSTTAQIQKSLRADFVSNMRLVPGAVAIIAAASHSDRKGMAATAWSSVCADPPTLLVCVNRQASAHQLIKVGGLFSINLLPASENETVAIFSAQRGLEGADRFLAGQWEQAPLGQPFLLSAIASFECSLVASHSHGSHDVLIGEVRNMRAGPGAPPMIYLDGSICTAGPVA